MRGEEQLTDGTGQEERSSSPPDLHPAGYTPPAAPLGFTQRTGKPPLHWLHVEIIMSTLQLLSDAFNCTWPTAEDDRASRASRAGRPSPGWPDTALLGSAAHWEGYLTLSIIGCCSQLLTNTAGWKTATPSHEGYQLVEEKTQHPETPEKQKQQNPNNPPEPARQTCERFPGKGSQEQAWIRRTGFSPLPGYPPAGLPPTGPEHS